VSEIDKDKCVLALQQQAAHITKDADKLQKEIYRLRDIIKQVNKTIIKLGAM